MIHAQRSTVLASSADVPATRRWAAAGLCAVALLVLPVLTWLLFSPGAPAPARGRMASAEAPGRVAPVVKVPPQAEAPQAAARRPVDTPAAFAGDGVEGEVEDPNGKPVAGASVTCKLGERELSAQSDESGHFQLTGEA